MIHIEEELYDDSQKWYNVTINTPSDGIQPSKNMYYMLFYEKVLSVMNINTYSQ